MPGRDLLLAKNWNAKIDPTGYLISEKLDGMRAYWDGQKLYSRQGNVISSPAFFTQHFPSVPLDGELWFGKNAFQTCLGIVKGQNVTGQKEYKEDDWKELVFQAFDAPDHTGSFKERLGYLKTILTEKSSDGKSGGKSDGKAFVRLVIHEECKGADHLQSCLEKVLATAGEGLMLRCPKSQYEGKRSSTLLKVKKFDEMEAKVTGHEKGKGRLSELTGKLQCELPSGIDFKVGSGLTDRDRTNPPKIGSIITVKHQGLTTGGKPRFPVFFRVRSDVSWDDLLKEKKPEAKTKTKNKRKTKPKLKAKARAKKLKEDEEERDQDDQEEEDQEENEENEDQNGTTKPKKPPCQYGAQCYRKNPQHAKDYSH